METSLQATFKLFYCFAFISIYVVSFICFIKLVMCKKSEIFYLFIYLILTYENLLADWNTNLVVRGGLFI